MTTRLNYFKLFIHLTLSLSLSLSLSHIHLIIIDANFWQKGSMKEEAQQYERDEEMKQQNKDHWARMIGIIVHMPTK